MPKLSDILSRSAVPSLVGLGLTGALLAWLLGYAMIAHGILLVTLVAGSCPLLLEIIEALRRRHFGVDLIAIVAIISSLLLGQYLAGTVILLMLSGGEALEDYALRRARKELTNLVSRVPRVAHLQEGKEMRDVPAESLKPGDLIVVKAGEMIPADGDVVEGMAMVDESALTGESRLVEKYKGAPVMSGSVSEDGVLTVKAVRPSSESRYAQIVRLVREAEEQKAPFVRLADRYSVWFTTATFLLAGLAWILSHDPLRLLSVLVVATPCPLILATPIAFAAGISKAAGRGIIVRNGGALEKLGEAQSFVFDKTGTLTLGVPALTAIEAHASDADHILAIAASLDQLSAHVLARSLVQAAREKGITLFSPEGFQEEFGRGVIGSIGGKRYIVGRLSFVQSQGIPVSASEEKKHEAASREGRIAVYLADDAAVLGTLFFADTVRPNVRSLFAGLRTFGIRRVLMLTGDKRNTALRIAGEIGLSQRDVRSECLPADKVREVKALSRSIGPVVMVGDGINDAPALAAADVGIAMGQSSTASSEAGDVVILVDQIERVGEALSIGHQVLRIAKQSIYAGIGLSIVLMMVASLGYIPPVGGAMLQEVVDVLVILNALRVLGVRTEK